MRPRTQFMAFQPPVTLSDLEGKITPSGYLLISEPDNDTVTAALDLQNLSQIPRRHLEDHATPVLYVPWCATVADVFQRMGETKREVAAVVNEYGETIGILTHEDVIDTVFTLEPSRSQRLWRRKPMKEVEPGVWNVDGVTSLSRLSRYLKMELPYSKNTTLGGVVQEVLQRLPERGAQGAWGPFDFVVLEAHERSHMLVQLRLNPDAEEDEA
jgi:CBS domain containing-hemolysin-like protein